MKTFKKLVVLCLVAVIILSVGACSNDSGAGQKDEVSASVEIPKFADIKIGEDYTDLTATISYFHNRTDMDQDGRMANYIAEFNKLYPNITIKASSVVNYEEQAMMRLTTGDWGDMMYMNDDMLSVDFDQYFMPWGTVEELSPLMKCAENKSYQGVVYGLPMFLNVNGIAYNKRVFEEAGITEYPTTPEEFHEALVKIRDNTDAIPMYTNYADAWPIKRWTNIYRNLSVGDAEFQNDKIFTMSNPFADPGDGTGMYNLYKMLYDAVADNCTEEDYTTTDWDGAKTAFCNGEIGCMLLGFDYLGQAGPKGDHPEDLAYGPLPITVNGKQYLGGVVDSPLCINKNSSSENQLACMIFGKWLATKSTYCVDNFYAPAQNDGVGSPLIEALDEYEIIFTTPMPDDKAETYKMVKNLTNDVERGFELVEAAAHHSETYDEIVATWNEAWTEAQKSAGIEVTE